ncbi:MAG: NimC/NimA family protein [Chloroflexi bacterium]|nr:NimC/NimA family protein [Chloroflexota bacterium]
MRETIDYLKFCPMFFLATVDGDRPRVRPFGATSYFEDKFYIQTGNIKPVFKQMKANPKIEICASRGDGTWIRIEAEVVQDDRSEARQHMLDENPTLKDLYAADDGNCEVLYLKNAKAVISSFGTDPIVYSF